MKIPTYLKHKPVFIAEDYYKIDGRMAGDSDTKGLSIGLAQWNERGKVDISAKVWRHTGEKWSRQSEEMPLHRVLDLAILICRTKLYLSEFNQNNFKKDNAEKIIPNNKNKFDIDRIPVQGESINVKLCEENEMLYTDLELLTQALAKDDELISERLNRLQDLLLRINKI